jgi:hypothetical protein
MEDNTKEDGLMIKCMVRDSSYGLREKVIKGCMKEI